MILVNLIELIYLSLKILETTKLINSSIYSYLSIISISTLFLISGGTIDSYILNKNLCLSC